MTKVGNRRLLVFALAGCLAAIGGGILAGGDGPSPPHPQAAKPAARPPLQHEVSVTLKLIQVFVTDAGGKPALDLDKSDFALTDNGRPQTITDFERHALGLPAVRPAELQAAPAAAPNPSPAAGTPPPLLSRKFIFLIDYCRNGLEGVAKAKLAAMEFLETKVASDDEVALFTLSPMSGLTLYENLTKDHAKVRSKIKKLREFVGSGSSGGDILTGDLMGMELLSASITALHVGHAGPTQRNLFGDIAEWAKALRAIPGQKNIIWFTMGYGTGAVRPGSLNNVLFEAMARALASANAPVFTVDTTPETVGPSGTTRGVLPELSLAYLSETTGGKFLGSVNSHSRIAAELHDATANYYVLGYYIPAAWDGKYHEIKVEVLKPGFRIHAQRGYFNPVPFAKFSPIEKHLHLLGLALGDTTMATRTLDFPMTALPFAAPGAAANVLLVGAPDADGIRSSIGERTELVTLILNEDKAIAKGERAEVDWGNFKAGSGTIFEYSLASLTPGRYDCRVIIRNLDDGRAAVGSCAVEVGAAPARGPSIFPPLLLVKGGEGHYLNLASAEGGGEQGLSITGIYPFPAKDHMPLVGSLERDAGELTAMLKCVWSGVSAGVIELDCSLREEGGGEEIPVPAEILDTKSREDGLFYLIRLELPPLEAGGYDLVIRARDETGADLARTNARIGVGPQKSPDKSMS